MPLFLIFKSLWRPPVVVTEDMYQMCAGCGPDMVPDMADVDTDMESDTVRMWNRILD